MPLVLHYAMPEFSESLNAKFFYDLIILQDKSDDVCSSTIYRPITLVPIISKFFGNVYT